MKIFGEPHWLVLARAELVKIVVAGNGPVGRRLFIRAERAFDDAVQLGFGQRFQRVGQRADRQRTGREEPAAAQVSLAWRTSE